MDETGFSHWPSVAVVGAGAVGCYYGGMLARAGAPVILIGRAAHVNAIRERGLVLERSSGSLTVPAQASTELSAAREASLVLFCVKTVDTETAAQAIRPHLGSRSLVVSLQNGVDNAERMYAAAAIEALPAVVYVACAMAGPGHVRHSGLGELVIGNSGAGGAELSPEAIAGLFERAEVPCRVSRNIATELWTKMVVNCAYNAISALGRARYGRMLDSGRTRELMEQVIKEAVAVARAGGVPLDEAGLREAAFRLGEAMRGATSSTAQDIAGGRPTEIDSLNGLIVRRAKQLGIPAPVNQTLFTLIKLLEGSPRA